MRESTLPPNVLRPQPADWTSSWGDGPPPPPFGGSWVELGVPLGLAGLGASIGRLPPGRRPCPLHHHLLEEEVFVVLEGVVTVRELPDGAEAYVEYELHPGEAVVYPPGTGLAHQSHNRGEVDAVYLCLSDGRHPDEICVYPDSDKVLIRRLGRIGLLGVDPDERVAHLAEARARAGSREVERLELGSRPAHVAADLEERELGGGLRGAQISRSAGATAVFVNRDRLAPGARTGPLHSHTADTELVLVLEGHPTLRQVREGQEEEVVLQPGDVVGWRPADGIAHHVLNRSEADAVLLVVGTHQACDVTLLPEQDEVHVRALGRTGRLSPTGYFDGERASSR